MQRPMCCQEFVICREIGEDTQYLMEERGDDCYTDDLGCAKLYSLYKDIPWLTTHERVAVVESCEDGSIEFLHFI